MSIEEGRNLKYEDIIRLPFEVEKETIIIDVRELAELDASGRLPGSVNIPLGDLKSSLELTDSEFRTRFNLPKPGPNAYLVFSCRTDRRSRIAVGYALELGYYRSRFYEGGFCDWLKQTT